MSGDAVNTNLPQLYPVLIDGLNAKKWRVGTPILCEFGRVKLAEVIAARSGARLTILLIGERPGGDAAAAKSLSAYLVYQLLDPDDQAKAAKFSGNPSVRFEYSVISNIYPGGISPIEAGSLIVDKVGAILDRRAAGNRLESGA